MACLSFYLAAEAAAEAETASTGVKENLVAEAAAAVEPLLCTLTLKKPMICIQAATYHYILALAALAVKAGTDLQLEPLEEILLQSLKIVLIKHCVRLDVVVVEAALVTHETQQQIQLAVQAARFLILMITMITLSTLQAKQG